MQKGVYTYLIILLLVILSACATVVRPTGGPRDLSPPLVVDFNPPNGNMNMKKDKIVIKFSEFIILKKLNEQMVVSPQMPDKPIVKISGKKLIVELPDSLRDNTTYTIFFGDAVVNYKENIPVHNFSYVFSTGDVVDSLRVKGSAVKAFDHSSYDELFVMLYQSKDDSALYKEKPYYLTKTERNGKFYLNNLAPGEYQIYALKDANRNYIYDQPDEEIAFCQKLIIPTHPSSFIATDSNPAPKKPKDINLFVFKEWPKEAKFMSKKVYPPHKVLFTFNRPIKDFRLIPLDFTPKQKEWHFDVHGVEGDSITSYLLGVDQDSIDVILADGDFIMDTLELVLVKPKRKIISTGGGLFSNKNKVKKQASDTIKKKIITKIKFTSNIGKTVHFFSELGFTFKVPLSNYKADRIKLYKAKDTLWLPVKSESRILDEQKMLKINIRANFEERKKYKLVVEDSTFFDLYGSTNDSIGKIFQTTEMREYGSLDLVVDYSGSQPLIIQMLNAKDVVIREDFITEPQTINYPYLVEGKYKIKAIVDINKNGKWDSGDFEKRILPERIYYVNKIIDIRSNWDNEQIWKLEIDD